MPKNNPNHNAHRASTAVRDAPTDKIYPVYAKMRVLGETPLFYIDKETRRVWMEDGAIESINHGRASRLKLNLPPQTQPSQAMGPGITEGILLGEKAYAQACLEAWAPFWRWTGIAA